jgi:site-specific DNA recombinase
MRIAIYVRVSTLRQAQAQTLEQQIERLQSHIQAHGWHLLDQNIFRDDGYSGATLKRPGLDRLRDKVAAAEFDLVLITAPDRLARNYVHQVLLLEELGRFGCRIEFVDRPMSQDPHDQLLLQIRGAVAEYERSLIAERMRRGRLAKLRAGLLLPWTRAPYGYRFDPQRPRDPAGVRVDAAEAAVVAELFAFYSQESTSLFGLAKHLYAQGVPSPTAKKRWGLATLRGILTNPTYTGQVYAGRMRYRPPRIRRSALLPIGHPHDTGVPTPPPEWIPCAKIPAIVTHEQFESVQTKLAHNQSFARRNNKTNQYLLRALVSCGLCQLSCLARKVQPDNKYYVCSGKVKAIQRSREERCLSRFIPADQLDDLVWKDLCQLLRHPQMLAQALSRAHAGEWLPQQLQARRENLRKGQVSLENQLERLTEAYLSQVIALSEYKRRRRELEQKSQALAAQAQQLEVQVDRQKELTGMIHSIEDFCQRVQTGLATATLEQKRQLVELLIDRVVVTNGEVEIRYIFPTSPSSEHIRFCHLRSDYFYYPSPCRILFFRFSFNFTSPMSRMCP